jgi:transcriptional regulator with XRE-family HTH domain
MMSTRGERIRLAMKLRGVKKQQALAAELKVHESAITRWKDSHSMSLENAIAFCSTLDVSIDWLLLGRGTIDSHRVPSRDPGVITRNGVSIPFPPTVGDRSINLIIRTIESIVDDVTPT